MLGDYSYCFTPAVAGETRARDGLADFIFCIDFLAGVYKLP